VAIIQRKDTTTSYKVQPEYFTDFTDAFNMHPLKKDLTRVINENSVKQSIRNLLLTSQGDRLFNNSMGSNIRALLFEQPSPAMEQLLSDMVRNTIDNYEPRARVLDVKAIMDDTSDTLAVTVVFALINNQEPITLDVIIDRIR
jgi:phage baseplate assembly protein W